MLDYQLIVSDEEFALLQTIREIGYGEIYSVEVPEGEIKRLVKLSRGERDLIHFIRAGHQDISVLQVHKGEPTFAEIDSKIRGFSTRTKFRFPTE